QEIAHSEASQGFAPSVLEHISVRRIVGGRWGAGGEFLEELRCPRPNRTQPHFVAFAQEAYLMWWIKAHVTDFEIEDLLYARAGVQCSQTRIACGDAILPFGFQMAEEPCDPFRGEIIQFERFDPSPGVLCRVAQEKENSIAVTAEGMEAQPTLVRQVFLKEAV